MNDAEKQLLKALRTISFNNAAAAEWLDATTQDLSELGRERLAMARQLLRDADSLEVFVQEISEERIARSP